MIIKTIVWFGIKLYGLIGKLYGLERNCIVSNHESYGLGRVWGRQVCPEKSGTGTCTLRMHIHVESVKQSFSIMIFVPVVEHAPTLTVCLSLTNLKEPISQGDLWNFWFDKSLWKLSWVLHKIHTLNCELRCFISYYPSLVSKCKKYSAYMVKFMNDCLMENHCFEIHLMTFCERTTQQLIELDAFTVVIKHDTVETNINMFNNVIWPLTQNILKITGIMSLKFGTPHCLQGTPFLGTHGVPGTPKC